MTRRPAGTLTISMGMIWAWAIAGTFSALAGHAQPGEQPRVTFEVASIRPATQQEVGEGNSRSQTEYAPDGVTMRNVNLGEMVEWAYGLEHYQVVGPSALEGQRYDVRAKAGERVAVGTLKLMLQNLLATRFKVQLHREQKKTSVYELVVAKGGPTLPENKAGKLPPAYAKESLPRIVDGSFVFRNVSMSDFAQQLTELRGIELPVVDRTGIEGIYDITLKSAASAILESDGSSLLTLIHEQLGLKLVSAKDAIEVVVVDHAEKPSVD